MNKHSRKAFRKVLGAKIHRATVTDANLEYEGSITIPAELLRLSDIREYEAVQVWNINNGARFETYAISGEEGSSSICVNGAAARLAKPGDLVIIAAFIEVAEEELCSFRPNIVFVDDNNRPLPNRPEIPGPRTVANF